MIGHWCVRLIECGAFSVHPEEGEWLKKNVSVLVSAGVFGVGVLIVCAVLAVSQSRGFNPVSLDNVTGDT